MATQFFSLLNKFLRLTAPEIAQNQKKALLWFRDVAQKIKITNPDVAARYMTNRPGIARIRPIANLNSTHIGRLIMFQYYAKWDKKLPYWDALPCVFPIRFFKSKNGPAMLGLNLHYLPPAHRARLMDAIYAHHRDKYLTESKRLQLSYDILNSSSKFRWFRPCIKMYLFSHVRSRFNLVSPEEWDMVAFLPLARWKKASESTVWKTLDAR